MLGARCKVHTLIWGFVEDLNYIGPRNPLMALLTTENVFISVEELVRPSADSQRSTCYTKLSRSAGRCALKHYRLSSD